MGPDLLDGSVSPSAEGLIAAIRPVFSLIGASPLLRLTE
jgi:hypothetical protein